MSLTYIPINDYKNIGGPTTFLSNLAKYFDQQGVEYSTDNHNESKSILFPIEYDTKILKDYKKTKRPVIQRLDGLVGLPWQTFKGMNHFFLKTRYEYGWLGLKKHTRFMLDMIKIYNIYNNYSDHIIFQSQYCKNLCFDMLHELPKDKYSVIHNGVHNDIFFPSIKKSLSNTPTFIMTGRFRREDMILPALDALDLLQESYNFTLKLIGPIEKDSISNELKKRSYIIEYGSLNSHEIANELRKADIYIFLSLNAPCPNALLEAISSGLPIVSYDYGSVKELLSFNTNLIASVSESRNPLIKGGQHLDHLLLMEKLKDSLDRFNMHKEIALRNSNNFNFDKCGDKYLSTIKNLLSSNL